MGARNILPQLIEEFEGGIQQDGASQFISLPSNRGNIFVHAFHWSSFCPLLPPYLFWWISFWSEDGPETGAKSPRESGKTPCSGLSDFRDWSGMIEEMLKID